MDFYLKFDPSMPIQLKTHILDLEQQIISHYVWKNDAKNPLNNTLKQFISLYLQGKSTDELNMTQSELKIHEVISFFLKKK